MGEAETNDNWLSSWFSAAKNKSAEVLEFVKKDLEEFGTAVKNEATNVVSSTGSVIERSLKLDSPTATVTSLKKNLNSLIDQVNTVLSPIGPDDSDTEAIRIIGDGSETVTLSKLEQAVFNLQNDDVTYTTDPSGELHTQYECWLELAIDTEQLSRERIAKHLESSTVLDQQYQRLVPNTVPYSLFWRRYLFKKALLEDKLAREEIKSENLQNATTTITTATPTPEEPNNLESWEHEVFTNNAVDLSEEEQMKLLADYECEIRQKPSKKPAAAAAHDINGKSNQTIVATIQSDVASKSANSNSPGIRSTNEGSSSSSTDGDWEKLDK